MEFANSKEIVFVCLYLSKGGAERVISILCNYFSQKGYKVILTILQEKVIDYVLDDNIEIIDLSVLLASNKYLGYIKQICHLRKIIKDRVVISFLHKPIILTTFASLFMKNKLIFSERNAPKLELKNPFLRHLRSFCFLFTSKAVFQTEEAKNYFYKIIQKKGVIIPNPIISNLPYWNRNNHKKRLISACRFVHQKNIFMAIDSFGSIADEFPDYIYEIYGDGILRNELEDYISKKGLNDRVFLKGYTKEIHSIMSDSAIFLQSSNFEGISNSMLEALAIGLPCVCTDCPAGGTRMMIKNDVNGILVSINAVDEMANSIRKILNNSEYAGSLSQNAQNIRSEYSEDIICQKWFDIVEDIIEKVSL